MIGNSRDWYNSGKRLCNVKSLAVFMGLSSGEAYWLAHDFVSYDLDEAYEWFESLGRVNEFDDYVTTDAGVKQMVETLRNNGWFYTDYKSIQAEYDFCEYTFRKVIRALADLELAVVLDDIEIFFK